MTAVLQLDTVTRVHGEGETAVQALRGVSFAAHAGELVAIMGPSGSGKSTLLTLAGGLDSPTSGTVSVEGTDLASLGANGRARMRRTSIGYVFQDFNLIPALTAVENVALPRELDGESSRAARKLARVALEEVGIGELADRFPDNMSGGQQQRVAIARAVVGDRRLILADEPTGALDTETGEEILRLLRARCDAGAAGVLVTHEARHAAWADRVVFLRDGVVVDETGHRPGRGAGGRAARPGEPPGRLAAAAPAGPPRRTAPPRQVGAGAGDDRAAGARGHRRRRDDPDRDRLRRRVGGPADRVRRRPWSPSTDGVDDVKQRPDPDDCCPRSWTATARRPLRPPTQVSSLLDGARLLEVRHGRGRGSGPRRARLRSR